MTKKARGAASPPLSARAREKWRTESAKSAAGPFQGFNLSLAESETLEILDFRVTAFRKG
jgi:hypothetical protein